MYPLAAAAQLPPEPSLKDLAPALTNAFNLPMLLHDQASYSNCTFVDDNGVLALRSSIKSSLHNSIVTAFLFLGGPKRIIIVVVLPLTNGNKMLTLTSSTWPSGSAVIH
jgi:hypothetical protein